MFTNCEKRGESVETFRSKGNISSIIFKMNRKLGLKNFEIQYLIAWTKITASWKNKLFMVKGTIMMVQKDSENTHDLLYLRYTYCILDTVGHDIPYYPLPFNFGPPQMIERNIGPL